MYEEYEVNPKMLDSWIKELDKFIDTLLELDGKYNLVIDIDKSETLSKKLGFLKYIIDDTELKM